MNIDTVVVVQKSVQEQVGQHKSGYHVLQVLENSPAEGVLIPYFDFVVGILGSQDGPYLLAQEGVQLSDIFKSHIDQPLGILVYNLASGQLREARIVPSTNWGGNGLVGISIRWSSFSKTLDLVWHVMEMEPNSPADQSELVSMTDYIIGSPSVHLPETESFFHLLQDNVNREIYLYVYSSETENVRVVSVTPKNNWGGKGVLGCGIGTGLLHRPPAPTGISKGVPLSQTFIPLESPSPLQTQTQKQTRTQHDPFKTPPKQPVNNDTTAQPNPDRSNTHTTITNTPLLTETDNSLEFSSFVQSNISLTPVSITNTPPSHSLTQSISPIPSIPQETSSITNTPAKIKIPFLPLDNIAPHINLPSKITQIPLTQMPLSAKTENTESKEEESGSLAHEFQQVELK